jgi:serine/threonine-protein kinase HipA
MIAVGRRDLSMAFGKWGRYANRDNLLSLCDRFLLSIDEATHIVDEMTTKVQATWYNVARNAGVSETDCERIRSAFVYEGFGYDLYQSRDNLPPPPQPKPKSEPQVT